MGPSISTLSAATGPAILVILVSVPGEYVEPAPLSGSLSTVSPRTIPGSGAATTIGLEFENMTGKCS